MAISVPGTVITVLVKGAACGLAAGLVYKLLEKHSRFFAVISASVICPIVNTGIFLLGCTVFFWDTVGQWGSIGGFSNTIVYMFVGLVGANFLVETAVNVALSPMVVRVIGMTEKRK